MPQTHRSKEERDLTEALKASHIILLLSGLTGTITCLTLYAAVWENLNHLAMKDKLWTVMLCGIGGVAICLVGIIASAVRFCSAVRFRQKALHQFFLEIDDVDFTTEEEDEIIDGFFKKWKPLCLLCDLMYVLPIVMSVLLLVMQFL